MLLTTLKEHSGAVNRLLVSPDQAFFASASADRTVKIWQTRQLDRVAFPRYFGAVSCVLRCVLFTT